MATDLYGRMHSLENYLREIINSYMCIVHGGDWFEKYSYEGFLNKYLKFSEWFRKSDYDLFKQVDNHLFNLEIDDIFDALKAAKKKQLSGTVIKALEEIKKQEKEMNRSIQSEGTFGIIKWDRSYKRLFRRGEKNVILELTLISCGFNLNKYHNKKYRKELAA